MHLQQAANALRLAARGVQYAVTGLQVAGVHADEHQLADKRVRHDLESQARERFAIGGLWFPLLFWMGGVKYPGWRGVPRGRADNEFLSQQAILCVVFVSRCG